METEAEPEYGPGGVASLQQSMASSLVGHLENLEFLGTILYNNELDDFGGFFIITLHNSYY